MARKMENDRQRTVQVNQYAVLAEFLWYVDREAVELTEAEAFAVYERNRNYIDMERMNNREREFFERVKKIHGGGIT